MRVGEGGRKGVISAGSGALGKVKRGTFPPSLSLTHTLKRGGLAQSLAAANGVVDTKGRERLVQGLGD